MTSNINFKGIPVAKAQTAVNSFKIYRLGANDIDFARELQRNINLRKLMPNLKISEYNIWSSMIREALFDTSFMNTQRLLTTVNNSPCGIMNYSINKASVNLNYIGTWPQEIGKKVPFAGKTLFTALFKHFSESKALFINLVAMRLAPFDPMGKYLKLGFKRCGGDNYQEIMRIDRDRANKTLETLQQEIELSKIENASDVNLFDELKLPI